MLPPLVLSVPNQEAAKAQQLAQLRQKMLVVEQTIKASQWTLSKEEKELRKVEKALGKSTAILRKLNTKLSNIKKKIAGLHRQQTELSTKVSQQKQILADQLRSAYVMGKQQKIKLLLNQEQPDRLSRVMQYYDYFNRARVENVRELNGAIVELNSVKEALAQEKLLLSPVVGARKFEQGKLITAKKQRKTVLAGLQRSIKASGSELKLLQENEKRLAGLLSSIRQAIETIPIAEGNNKAFKSLKGKLRWPLKGALHKRFGTARKSGRFDGVLIAAREGATIRSISHGRVVYADWLRGYGLLLIIDHGENYLSLYAFNESLYKEVGDWVVEGEAVSTVGISGGQQKAGLYFSIRKNGKPVNPIHWCRAVKRGRVG
ncbi:MAG: peptidase M23 [Piscirickettsiaceae bacterium]|nr:MAG: peptidase M23 [Piscirickettsiaceae bacterium]